MGRRKWVCRCLGTCGKMELNRRPKRGLCPYCGTHCAPAIIASNSQSRDLAGKSWQVVAPASELLDGIESLGLKANPTNESFLADLSKIARHRKDVRNSKHLVAHRHILGRPGICNGDLKNRNALCRALVREDTSPFFPRPSLRDSPAVLGKFIEAELGLRASRRTLKTLSLVSERLVFTHPVLERPINVEIDGSTENTPVEVKTVVALDRISSKLCSMLMQLAGQAIAKGVDSGVLIIAERDGHHLTAVEVSGLAVFHLNNIERWASKASQGGVLA